jgi:hypothetical protein
MVSWYQLSEKRCCPPCPWPVLGHVDGYWNLIDRAAVDPDPYYKG